MSFDAKDICNEKVLLIFKLLIVIFFYCFMFQMSLYILSANHVVGDLEFASIDCQMALCFSYSIPLFTRWRLLRSMKKFDFNNVLVD